MKNQIDPDSRFLFDTLPTYDKTSMGHQQFFGWQKTLRTHSINGKFSEFKIN